MERAVNNASVMGTGKIRGHIPHANTGVLRTANVNTFALQFYFR